MLVQYPDLEPLLDEMLPKKSPLIVAKWWVAELAIFFFYIISSIKLMKLYNNWQFRKLQ